MSAVDHDAWQDQLIDEISEIVRLKNSKSVSVMKGGFRKALRIIDAQSQIEYRKTRYRFGSTKKQRRDRGGRFRDYASKATAYKYQWRKGRKAGAWKYRSMMRRSGDGSDNYQGNLTHLLENGSWNYRTKGQNQALKIRQTAFDKKKNQAEQAAIQGMENAIVDSFKRI